jgi:hypothetical protein
MSEVYVQKIEANGDREFVVASPFASRKAAEAHIARLKGQEVRDLRPEYRIIDDVDGS